MYLREVMRTPESVVGWTMWVAWAPHWWPECEVYSLLVLSQLHVDRVRTDKIKPLV